MTQLEGCTQECALCRSAVFKLAVAALSKHCACRKGPMCKAVQESVCSVQISSGDSLKTLCMQKRTHVQGCTRKSWGLAVSKLALALSPAMKFNNLNGPTLTPLMEPPKQMQLVHVYKCNGFTLTAVMVPFTSLITTCVSMMSFFWSSPGRSSSTLSLAISSKSFRYIYFPSRTTITRMLIAQVDGQWKERGHQRGGVWILGGLRGTRANEGVSKQELCVFW